MMKYFDKYGCNFVSITQAFDTSTSMGKLTLNMLLSFAQFEREVASERVRDKIRASKAKGLWMGGNPPLGYDIKDKKLVINEAEAQQVRHLFEKYLELQSVKLHITSYRKKFFQPQILQIRNTSLEDVVVLKSSCSIKCAKSIIFDLISSLSSVKISS